MKSVDTRGTSILRSIRSSWLRTLSADAMERLFESEGTQEQARGVRPLSGSRQFDFFVGREGMKWLDF